MREYARGHERVSVQTASILGEIGSATSVEALVSVHTRNRREWSHDAGLAFIVKAAELYERQAGGSRRVGLDPDAAPASTGAEHGMRDHALRRKLYTSLLRSVECIQAPTPADIVAIGNALITICVDELRVWNCWATQVVHAFNPAGGRSEPLRAQRARAAAEIIVIGGRVVPLLRSFYADGPEPRGKAALATSLRVHHTAAVWAVCNASAANMVSAPMWLLGPWQPAPIPSLWSSSSQLVAAFLTLASAVKADSAACLELLQLNASDLNPRRDLLETLVQVCMHEHFLATVAAIAHSASSLTSANSSVAPLSMTPEDDPGSISGAKTLTSTPECSVVDDLLADIPAATASLRLPHYLQLPSIALPALTCHVGKVATAPSMASALALLRVCAERGKDLVSYCELAATQMATLIPMRMHTGTAAYPAVAHAASDSTLSARDFLSRFRHAHETCLLQLRVGAQFLHACGSNASDALSIATDLTDDIRASIAGIYQQAVIPAVRGRSLDSPESLQTIATCAMEMLHELSALDIILQNFDGATASRSSIAATCKSLVRGLAAIEPTIVTSTSPFNYRVVGTAISSAVLWTALAAAAASPSRFASGRYARLQTAVLQHVQQQLRTMCDQYTPTDETLSVANTLETDVRKLTDLTDVCVLLCCNDPDGASAAKGALSACVGAHCALLNAILLGDTGWRARPIDSENSTTSMFKSIRHASLRRVARLRHGAAWRQPLTASTVEARAAALRLSSAARDAASSAVSDIHQHKELRRLTRVTMTQLLESHAGADALIDALVQAGLDLHVHIAAAAQRAVSEPASGPVSPVATPQSVTSSGALGVKPEPRVAGNLHATMDVSDDTVVDVLESIPVDELDSSRAPVATRKHAAQDVRQRLMTTKRHNGRRPPRASTGLLKGTSRTPTSAVASSSSFISSGSEMESSAEYSSDEGKPAGVHVTRHIRVREESSSGSDVEPDAQPDDGGFTMSALASADSRLVEVLGQDAAEVYEHSLVNLIVLLAHMHADNIAHGANGAPIDAETNQLLRCFLQAGGVSILTEWGNDRLASFLQAL